MSDAYFEDQVFEGADYTTKGLTKGQYEVCSFVNCDFPIAIFRLYLLRNARSGRVI